MFTFDCITKKYKRITVQKFLITHRILIVEGSESGKTNPLLNLINNEPDIDKIYLYANNQYEAKYQLLINKRKSTSWNYLNDLKAFIEYLNDMNDVFKNIEE